MTLLKKSIVLAKNGAKGYLTIVRVGGSTGIKVIFNDKNIKGLVLGLKIGTEKLVVKSLDSDKNEFDLKDANDFKNTDDISCLIMLESEIYAEGGVRGRVQPQDILLHIKNNEKKINENSFHTKNENKKEVNYGKRDQNEFNRQAKRYDAKVSTEASQFIQKTEQGVKKEAPNNVSSKFFENSSMPKDAKNFYISVKDKLDELFVMYPREIVLEKMVPSSKWVKINYDKNDYYVAGVLVDDDGKTTHIAYGVPGYEGMTPPKETECICDWLPIKDMQKFQGYWLIFQSADTGEIIPND